MTGRRKELRFKRLLLILLGLVMMLAVVSCSKSGNDESAEGIKNPGAAQPSAKEGKDSSTGSKKKIKVPPKGWIKKAYFSTQKGKDGTSLKIKVETAIPLEENQYFSYVYWKNGKKLAQKREDTLAPSSYKKGDVIFAYVFFHQDDILLQRKRSQMILVPNSSPDIKEVAIPEILGPGTYKITVRAEDTDQDKITFSLLNAPGSDSLPKVSQLTVDPETGTITLALGEKPPPEKLKFVIAANDGDGGVAKKAVTIPFKIYKVPGRDKDIREKEKDGSKSKEKGDPNDSETQ